MKFNKLMIGILLILISGCGKKGITSDKINYSSYHGYFFEFNITEKIENKKQIEDILKRKNNLTEDIINKLENYDENYFEEKDLIFIYIPYGSGSIKTNFKKLKITDKLKVYIELIYPEAGTTDMSGYLYLIEVSKVNKDLEVYIQNKKETYPIKPSYEFNKTYKVIDIKDGNDCKYITLKSYTSDDTYTFLHCDNAYITFEENKNYKFTFTAYNLIDKDVTMKDLFSGHFINTKIEETSDIVNDYKEKYTSGYTLNDGRVMHFSLNVPYKKTTLGSAIMEKQISMDNFLNNLEVVSSLRDGGSKIYKYDSKKQLFGNEDFFVVVCHSLDGLNDIYISPNMDNLFDKCTLKIDDLDGVSMHIKNNTLTNAGATIIITDTSNRRNIYGTSYEIQRYENNKWVKLTPLHELIFTSMGYYIGTDNTLEFKIDWTYHYGKLKKGKYRILKATSEEGEAVEHYITAEFDIK